MEECTGAWLGTRPAPQPVATPRFKSPVSVFIVFSINLLSFVGAVFYSFSLIFICKSRLMNRFIIDCRNPVVKYLIVFLEAVN